MKKEPAGNNERSATFPFHAYSRIPIAKVRQLGINNQLLQFESEHKVQPFIYIELTVLRLTDDAIRATEIRMTSFLMLTSLANISQKALAWGTSAHICYRFTFFFKWLTSIGT